MAVKDWLAMAKTSRHGVLDSNRVVLDMSRRVTGGHMRSQSWKGRVNNTRKSRLAVKFSDCW